MEQIDTRNWLRRFLGELILKAQLHLMMHTKIARIRFLEQEVRQLSSDIAHNSIAIDELGRVVTDQEKALVND